MNSKKNPLPPLPDAGAVPPPPRWTSREVMLRGFDDWLDQRGKAATTRRLYLRNAAEFIDWIAGDPAHPGESSDDLVARYFSVLEQRQPGNSGNLRRTTVAKAFLTYTGRPPVQGRSASGPYVGLRRGQGARYLEVGDTLAVLGAVRDRGEPQVVAITGLLLFAEMSPRLLCEILVSDLAGLDVVGQTWQVERGGQSWQFNVPGGIARLLLELAETRSGDDQPLFADVEGAPLSRSTLDEMMKGVGEKAGVPDLAAYRLSLSKSKRAGRGTSFNREQETVDLPDEPEE